MQTPLQRDRGQSTRTRENSGQPGQGPCPSSLLREGGIQGRGLLVQPLARPQKNQARVFMELSSAVPGAQGPKKFGKPWLPQREGPSGYKTRLVQRHQEFPPTLCRWLSPRPFSRALGIVCEANAVGGVGGRLWRERSHAVSQKAIFLRHTLSPPSSIHPWEIFSVRKKVLWESKC